MSDAPEPTRLSSHFGVAPYPRAALRAIGALRMIDQLEDGDMLDLSHEVKAITSTFLKLIGPPDAPDTPPASITICDAKEPGEASK